MDGGDVFELSAEFFGGAFGVEDVHGADGGGGDDGEVVNLEVRPALGTELWTRVVGGVEEVDLNDGMVAACELEGAILDDDVEGGVGVIAGADADGCVVDETAGIEDDRTIHGREESLTATECAVGQEDVATVAVDVEAVDVAAVEEGLAEVVGTENAPVAVGLYHLELGVIDVVHGECIAIVA